jgi:hypothetical protein
MRRCSGDDWQIFNSIRALNDSRGPEAESIWRQLEECFTCDELAVGLPTTFRNLRSKALQLLTKARATAAAPAARKVAREGRSGCG